jgi:hypothetical protein
LALPPARAKALEKDRILKKLVMEMIDGMIALMGGTVEKEKGCFRPCQNHLLIALYHLLQNSRLFALQ